MVGGKSLFNDHPGNSDMMAQHQPQNQEQFQSQEQQHSLSNQNDCLLGSVELDEIDQGDVENNDDDDDDEQ